MRKFLISASRTLVVITALLVVPFASAAPAGASDEVCIATPAGPICTPCVGHCIYVPPICETVDPPLLCDDGGG